MKGPRRGLAPTGVKVVDGRGVGVLGRLLRGQLQVHRAVALLRLVHHEHAQVVRGAALEHKRGALAGLAAVQHVGAARERLLHEEHAVVRHAHPHAAVGQPVDGVVVGVACNRLLQVLAGRRCMVGGEKAAAKGGGERAAAGVPSRGHRRRPRRRFGVVLCCCPAAGRAAGLHPHSLPLRPKARRPAVRTWWKMMPSAPLKQTSMAVSSTQIAAPAMSDTPWGVMAGAGEGSAASVRGCVRPATQLSTPSCQMPGRSWFK
jgi:hypothetical protein